MTKVSLVDFHETCVFVQTLCTCLLSVPPYCNGPFDEIRAVVAICLDPALRAVEPALVAILACRDKSNPRAGPNELARAGPKRSKPEELINTIIFDVALKMISLEIDPRNPKLRLTV